MYSNMRVSLNYGAKMDSACRYCRRKRDDCRLACKSLFYNQFTSWYTCMDTCMEPFYWFVDHFARYLGPILVVLVVVMVTSVVVIFYTCLLPEHYYRASGLWTIWHLVFGHWLLINIIFNYFMAAFTHPGRPPMSVPEVVSICKKCISPKPPRAHHCSICKTCILKMDHHCPWLNNCVGHGNHRYFFLFCIYIWLGTFYVCLCGYDLFKKHFYLDDQNYVFHPALYPLNMAYASIYKQGTKYGRVPDSYDQYNDKTGQSSYNPYIMYHHCVLYEFMLCSGVCLAVGLLVLWHARLISTGQTSIEMYINHKERKRLKEKGLVYKNPYHFGFWKNWVLFFGLENKNRRFWRHVLLPSSHYAKGDGLRWDSTTYKLDEVVTDLQVL